MSSVTGDTAAQIFGVPTVLTNLEAMELLQGLSDLWLLTYGSAPSDLESDLQLCKRFFDPLARGQTLRNRLSELPTTPARLIRTLQRANQPTVLEAGSSTLITGVEGRLLIQILEEEDLSEPVVVISPKEVAKAEHRALELYRTWAATRLTQVIDLRNGRGHEVMQAIAVGVVLALLVNRSDSRERAVLSQNENEPDQIELSRAIYAGAERFAEAISGKRRRSPSEQRLKSGYGISEARRRLAHRLVVVRPCRTGDSILYIPSKHRDEVVEFLGRDLARRSSLSVEALESAFDQLVIAFRASAGKLARRSMFFERAADTRDLREALLSTFRRAHDSGSPEQALSSDPS